MGTTSMKDKASVLPGEVVFKSVMFRLVDKGDPKKKADWRAREVLLDASGRAFFAAVGREPETICNGASFGDLTLAMLPANESARSFTIRIEPPPGSDAP